jgi:hypothetical protein
MKRLNPSTPFFWGFIGALIGFIGAVNLGKDSRFIDGAFGALIQFFLWSGISNLILKRRQKSALSGELQSQDQSLVSPVIGWVQSVYKTGSAPPLPKIGLKVWFAIFFTILVLLRLLGLWQENRRIYARFDPTFDELLNKFFDDVYSPLFIDIVIIPTLLDAFVCTSAIYIYRRVEQRLKKPFYKYAFILLLVLLSFLVAFFLVVVVRIFFRIFLGVLST